MTKLKTTLRLRGIRNVTASFHPKVWLGDKFLKLDKSIHASTLPPGSFGWGGDGKGAAQLALAVCLEIYPAEVARQVWRQFAVEFIAPILDDSFDLTLDLTAFHEKHLRDLVGEWEEAAGEPATAAKPFEPGITNSESFT